MLPLSEIAFIGTGLNRRECVLAHTSGLLFASDWTNSDGVAITAPDGRVRQHLARNAPRPLKPNGIALEAGGSFLLADSATRPAVCGACTRTAISPAGRRCTGSTI